MKKDEFKKLRGQSLQELRAKIVELKKELAAKKLEKVAGKLKNVRLTNKLRKDLAQILTVTRMLEFEGGLSQNKNYKEEEAAK